MNNMVSIKSVKNVLGVKIQYNKLLYIFANHSITEWLNRLKIFVQGMPTKIIFELLQ